MIDVWACKCVDKDLNKFPSICQTLVRSIFNLLVYVKENNEIDNFFWLKNLAVVSI